jgi:hypothetical protein
MLAELVRLEAALRRLRPAVVEAARRRIESDAA